MSRTRRRHFGRRAAGRTHGRSVGRGRPDAGRRRKRRAGTRRRRCARGRCDRVVCTGKASSDARPPTIGRHATRAGKPRPSRARRGRSGLRQGGAGLRRTSGRGRSPRNGSGRPVRTGRRDLRVWRCPDARGIGEGRHSLTAERRPGRPWSHEHVRQIEAPVTKSIDVERNVRARKSRRRRHGIAERDARDRCFRHGRRGLRSGRRRTVLKLNVGAQRNDRREAVGIGLQEADPVVDLLARQQAAHLDQLTVEAEDHVGRHLGGPAEFRDLGQQLRRRPDPDVDGGQAEHVVLQKAYESVHLRLVENRALERQLAVRRKAEGDRQSPHGDQVGDARADRFPDADPGANLRAGLLDEPVHRPPFGGRLDVAVHVDRAVDLLPNGEAAPEGPRPERLLHQRELVARRRAVADAANVRIEQHQPGREHDGKTGRRAEQARSEPPRRRPRSLAPGCRPVGRRLRQSGGLVDLGDRRPVGGPETEREARRACRQDLQRLHFLEIPAGRQGAARAAGHRARSAGHLDPLATDPEPDVTGFQRDVDDLDVVVGVRSKAVLALRKRHLDAGLNTAQDLQDHPVGTPLRTHSHAPHQNYRRRRSDKLGRRLIRSSLMRASHI